MSLKRKPNPDILEPFSVVLATAAKKSRKYHYLVKFPVATNKLITNNNNNNNNNDDDNNNNLQSSLFVMVVQVFMFDV